MSFNGVNNQTPTYKKPVFYGPADGGFRVWIEFYREEGRVLDNLRILEDGIPTLQQAAQRCLQICKENSGATIYNVFYDYQSTHSAIFPHGPMQVPGATSA